MLASDLIKPSNDEFAYRVLHMENGLKVLLISDPEAEKAACSMDVSREHGRMRPWTCLTLFAPR